MWSIHLKAKQTHTTPLLHGEAGALSAGPQAWDTQPLPQYAARERKKQNPAGRRILSVTVGRI